MPETPEKANGLHSLFVGRWQPFHAGHKALIETVLKRGKPVVVAIRDTEMSAANPYTTSERWTMIQEALREYGSLVKIVSIPDIDEICYGRDVGYGIRKIEVGPDIEAISGTKTRKEHPPARPIIWLTGQSGAGKSTLAEALAPRIPGSVILDGDEMRASISLGAGFSQEDRREHNLRVARLALVLAKRSPVIVSVIAPFEETRKEIDALIRPSWVYVERALPPSPDRPYEAPEAPTLTVNSDRATAEENAEAVARALGNILQP